MIRKSFYNELRKELGKGHFTPDEFEIEQSNQTSKVSISIKYRFDAQFYFKADIPNKAESDGNYKIIIACSPGAINDSEIIQVDSSYTFLRNVSIWTERIYEELVAMPINRIIVEQQKELEELIEKYKNLPDEYFSNEEVFNIRNQLDEIKNTITERLEATESDQKELKKKINDLDAEIEELKKTITMLKKPGWAGTLMIRMSTWFKDTDNKKLLKDNMADIGKMLITEVVKKQIGS